MNVLTKVNLVRRQTVLDDHKLQAAREFIDGYWPKLTRNLPIDQDTLVGLPKPYLVPAYDELAPFNFNEMYYWDSYFMVQGLLTPGHTELVSGILEDLVVLEKRFGSIPNASRTYLTGRSQPPMLTSLIFDVYKLGGHDEDWLADKMAIAQDEYQAVWMSDKKPNWRLVYQGLSRYYDVNMLHDLAEAESGWDMTTRFNHHCLDFLPVDLNSLLYKYETDFARAAELSGQHKQAKDWETKAKFRRDTMEGLMWDRIRGFYYDYNYKKGRIGRVSSLAGYFTMWAGLASEHQAGKMVKALKRFEQKGGLAATDQLLPNLPIGQPTQWAYPNGWAPLHLIVVDGLERYGYHAEARRIARKWLKTNLDWFDINGVFLEKYNVVNPNKPPAQGVYPCQTGFGWTNAVFENFCQRYL